MSEGVGEDTLNLAEIRDACERATPGPWEAPAYRYSAESPASYNTVVSEHANICGLHDGGQTRESIDANAYFIANARQWIPELLDALRQRDFIISVLRSRLSEGQ